MQQIVENKLKFLQWYLPAKTVFKKLIGTVAKSGVITVKNGKVSFQAREKSELQKSEAASQRAINALQRQKDLEQRKKLERLKKF